MPLPSLPVLSAITCSTQSPKLARASGRRKVALSRPCAARQPRASPSRAPGLSSTISFWQRGGGPRAKGGARKIPPADIRVGQEGAPETMAGGGLFQVAARVGDGGEMGAGLVRAQFFYGSLCGKF